MPNMLVVSELMDGKPRKSMFSAVAFARAMAAKAGGSFDILSIGAGAEGASAELATYGAGTVKHVEIDGGYTCEKYAATVAEVAKGYDVVIATANSYGKDLLPRVAAKLGAGYAADVIGFGDDGKRFRRSMYSGNVLGYCTVTTKQAVVSVRQTEFEPAAPSGGSSKIEAVSAVNDPAAARVEFQSLEVMKSERPELTEADIVVSGGRALKSAENFKTVLEPLVDALGAAMGASRAACDAGMVPGELQVGQTGKVVAPKLYFAVGISGAIQHLAGMKGSKTIVAINKNKDEPIAQVADYFLVADLFQAVPELTAAIKKVRA